MVAGKRLGCAESWHAQLCCRGGAPIIDLPFTQLTMSRRVDDMSDASVSIGHYTEEHDYIAPPRLRDDCAGVLATLEPWEHEIVLWRDDELVWAGPVIKPVWTRDTLTITCRDLFQWFERRLLPRDRDFFGTDLAVIFRILCEDALHRDPSPNITRSPSLTGIVGDRTIFYDAYLRAADVLRELARSGLDFTMIGRDMLVGGTEVPTADLGTLITQHFDGPELTADGLQTETESTVVGASTDSILGPVSATAGAPFFHGVRTVQPRRGLVQNVVTESGIEDETSALAAAQSRLALLGETPRTLTGRLLPDAPVAFSDLIPGARAELRVKLLAKTVEGPHRLQSVGVQVGEGMTEQVGVVFTNLGTITEVSA